MLQLEDILNTSITGDVIDVLPTLPDNSVHCIMTSPPYWAVRDYKIEPTSWPEITFSLFSFPITIPAQVCQLGQEKSPMEFIAHMVYVFRLANRVLRKDGTLWMNMGDCYNSKSGGYSMGARHNGNHNYISEGTGKARLKINRNLKTMKLKPKDMVGIPWMLAFALRDDGWYFRQDIIWNKPNPMPESTSDRCTKAHEYIFLFSKSKRYFFDAYAISTEVRDSSVKRLVQDLESQAGSSRAGGGMKHNGPMKPIRGKVATDRKGYAHKTGDQTKGLDGHSGNLDADGNLIGNGRANKKSVWTITTKGTTVDHFATYPEEVPFDPIKASTSEHGVCADCGGPWRRVIGKKLVKGKGGCNKIVIDERDIQADENNHGHNKAKDGHIPGWHYEYLSSSWVPTCQCHGKWEKETYIEIEQDEHGKEYEVKLYKHFYTPAMPLEDHPRKPAIVLDIFAGHNTTGLVARKLNRNFISIDKSPKYNGQSEKRLNEELGMFR